MTLPASGPISLNEMHIEAGGTTGTLVSINDSDIRSLISSTPGTVVSFDDFYGASSGSVDVQDTTFSDTSVYPDSATVTATAGSNGTNWWTSAPQSNVGSGYEIKFTKLGGATPTGSLLNQWLSLSSSRSLTITKSGDSPGLTQSQIRVEVRDAVTESVEDTATWTLQATVEI